MSSLPRRNPRSLPSISLLFSAALVLGVSSLGLAGCPGELNPRLLATGTGGTGGPTVCDAPAMMMSKCGQPGCHSASAPAAGLDLASAGVIARLLDKPSNTTANPVCADNTKPYLQMGTNPATGFMLDKLVNPAPCGTVMPQLPGPLNATEMQCFQEWSTAVTTGQIQ